MNPLALKQSTSFTYSDYLGWADDERWELINGRAYNMTPAPSRQHQAISRELLTSFHTHLSGSPCQVYAAPFDVRLAVGDEKDEDVQNVVQPDIVVICDEAKLDDKGCKGSPDLIIEILSPSTARKDLKEKFLLYEQTGVKEYWVIDPDNKIVTVYQQQTDGRFGRPDVYGEEDSIVVTRFPDLTIALESLFRV